jgi:hypothetical protein
MPTDVGIFLVLLNLNIVLTAHVGWMLLSIASGLFVTRVTPNPASVQIINMP